MGYWTHVYALKNALTGQEISPNMKIRNKSQERDEILGGGDATVM